MITYLDLHISLIEVQTDLKCLLMVTFTVRVYKVYKVSDGNYTYIPNLKSKILLLAA